MTNYNPSTITLKTISGNHCQLHAPFTLEALLSTAESQFHFVPETIKVLYKGKPRRVMDVLKKSRETDGSASSHPFTVSDVVSTPYSGGNSNSNSSTAAHSTVGSASTDSALQQSLNGDEEVVVLVFGIPKCVRRVNSGAVRTARARAEAAVAQQRQQQQQQTVESSKEASTLFAGGGASSTTAAAAAAGGGFIPGVQAEFPGPLLFPHCPKGLRDLGVIALEHERRTGKERYDAFCDELYIHPTMQHIIREVQKGHDGVLPGILWQIKAAAPAFFSWIERHSALFVRMLNRSLPTSMERERDALVALTQQLAMGMLGGNQTITVHLGGAGGEGDGDGHGSGMQLQLVIQMQPGEEDEEDSDDDILIMPNDDGDADHGDDNDEDDDSMWSSELEMRYEENLASSVSVDEAAVLSTRIEQVRDSQRTEEQGRYADEGTHGMMDSGARNARSRAEDVAVVAAMGRSGSKLSSSSSSSSSSAAAVGPSDDGTSKTQTEPIGTSFSSPGGEATLFAQAMGDPVYAELAGRVAQVSIRTRQICETAHTMSPVQQQQSVREVHAEVQDVSSVLMTEMESSLVHIDNETYFDWLVTTAGSFFAKAEEFYMQLVEKKLAMPIATSNGSAESYACIAALSKQLYGEAVRLIERCAHMAAGAPPNSGKVVNTAASTSGNTRAWMRVGALRNLPTDCSPLFHPCARWISSTGPSSLLHEMLEVARGQRASILWYTSHYFQKALGKTLQTVAYVFDGVNNKVRAARMLFNSKVHRVDEVTPVLQRISAAAASSAAGHAGVSNALRSEWGMLMGQLYKTLVKPIEAMLPPCNTNSNPLYVVDSRHEPAPRHTCDAWATHTNWQGCWFAGYCDEKKAMCVDKWCVATALLPWNIVLASEAPTCAESQRGPLVMLTSAAPSTTAPDWLSEELQDRLQFRQYALAKLHPQHAVILHEAITQSSQPAVTRSHSSSSSSVGADEETAEKSAPHGGTMSRSDSFHRKDEWVVMDHVTRAREPQRPPRLSVSFNGLAPALVGDFHAVDECNAETGVGQLLGMTPYHATLFHVHKLTSGDDVYAALYKGMVESPGAPLAALLRRAVLATMRANNAPWLSVEFTLMDYAFRIASLWPLLTVSRATKQQQQQAEVVSSTVGVTASPSAQGGTSLSDDAAAAAATAAVTDGNQYAEQHAVGEMYEMMLQHVLEARPDTEEEVLNTLIDYLESSKEEVEGALKTRKAGSM